jgi:hypothetical protein
MRECRYHAESNPFDNDADSADSQVLIISNDSNILANPVNTIASATASATA